MTEKPDDAPDGYEMVSLSDTDGVTPNSELRELVEQWRDGYDVYKRATDPEMDIQANVLEQCAIELEDLIDE